MPQLPNCPFETTKIGVGCAYLTAGSPTRHDHRLIHAAFEAGARHFDVAPMYGMGTAERVLGAALAKRRAQVTITTKAGLPGRPAPGYKLIARALAAPIRDKIRHSRVQQSWQNTASADIPVARPKGDFAPDSIRRSLENSLRALRTDWVDVLALHEARPEDITDDLIQLLLDAKAAGKIRALGIASTRADGQHILAQWPNVFEVVQFSLSALDAPIPAADFPAFRITHRSLMPAFHKLSAAMAQDPALGRRLSQTAEADLTAPETLARGLIGAAQALNPEGITLVASHSIARTRQNVQDGLAPDTALLGTRVLAALAQHGRVLDAAAQP
ncbi:hypothetical protein CKO11_11205 [Rhodobacter sp. TJ_12]|uniref:aldo/keto reductase n=1 Tax=Rhodobacter sp. TJ_12 TaxID=2029399 RepID=UPI001CC0A0FF|nr:aldo/keto reductase [Rhodobacter sp. TJ_12]MBZ4023027.1 hypothetical protein [Rhodobacter sp. TJ_12]